MSNPWPVLTPKMFGGLMVGMDQNSTRDHLSDLTAQSNLHVWGCFLAMFNVLCRHSHKFYRKATLMWLLGKQEETFDLESTLCAALSLKVCIFQTVVRNRCLGTQPAAPFALSITGGLSRGGRSANANLLPKFNLTAELTRLISK